MPPVQYMATARPAPLTRNEMIVGALILGLAAALRFYCIGNEPLWLDEGYSWWDARQSLADIWQLVPQCDPHPPLYALLLKGWIVLWGDSIIALRAFSATAGVIATAFVMLAGRELHTRVGWIAGMLFAIAPFQIEFAHEARPYTLVALGAAVVMFGALRVLRALRTDDPRAPAERLGWVALVAGTAILLWSNNTSVFAVAALGIVAASLFVFDASSRRLLRPMCIAGAIVFLLWLPYVPVYIEQARGVSADFWIPRPDAWRVANELRFVVGLGSFTALAILGALWGGGLALLWRKGLKREAWLLFGLVVLPVALNFAVSVLVKPVFIARALIGISPAAAVGIAVLLAMLDPRWFRLSAVGALAVVRVAVVVSMGLYSTENRKEPWDEIAVHLQREAHGEAVVLLVPNELALPLGHALADASIKLPLRGVPDDFPAPARVARYPSGKCAPSVVGQDLSKLVQTVSGKDTVLFVTRRNNVYDPNNQIAATLRRIGLREVGVREYRIGGIQVHTFLHGDSTRSAMADPRYQP